MASERLSEVRRREAESEKITINLGFVDLGHIDLLVEEGFYSNRTDFIRTAIRNQVLAHADVLKHSVARRSMVLGLATIDDDVPAQLASRAIGSITVLGALRASPQVKAVLADRIR